MQLPWTTSHVTPLAMGLPNGQLALPCEPHSSSTEPFKSCCWFVVFLKSLGVCFVCVRERSSDLFSRAGRAHKHKTQARRVKQTNAPGRWRCTTTSGTRPCQRRSALRGVVCVCGKVVLGDMCENGADQGGGHTQMLASKQKEPHTHTHLGTARPCRRRRPRSPRLQSRPGRRCPTGTCKSRTPPGTGTSWSCPCSPRTRARCRPVFFFAGR